MKRRTTYKRSTDPIVVESGDGWAICFDPSTRDYSLYIEGEYVGSRDTQTQARSLAFEQARRGVGS